MGNSETKTINIEGEDYSIKLENSDDKGTIDDEAMFQYISKARNATCQILLENNSYGSGFFCKIPYTNNKNLLLNVLITCEHVLNYNIIFSDKNIRININNNIKTLSLKNRKKWSNKEMDYSCIEILDEDNIDDFYQLDDIILKKNYNNNLYIEEDKKYLILFAIMKNRKRGHSIGLIKKIDNFYFIHNCNSYEGCSGGVIVNRNNNCVIGIHQGGVEIKKNKKSAVNTGIFIYNIINDIINSNNNKLKKMNEPELKIKKNKDLNGNYDCKININNDKLKKIDINESKIKIRRYIELNGNYDYRIDIVFYGPPACGAKTSLIKSFIKGRGEIENEITLGSDLNHIDIIYLNKQIKLLLIDTSGDKNFLCSIWKLIRKENIIIFGYDLTREESIEEIKYFWVPEFEDTIIKENIIVYLVGNKLDEQSKRQVSKEKAEIYAEEHNFKYFEISCKYYINIDELFEDILKTFLAKNKST